MVDITYSEIEMKYKLFSIVTFCLVNSIIAGIDSELYPSKHFCPQACDCEKLYYYNITKCMGNGTKFDVLLKGTTVSILRGADYRSGDYVVINCSPAVDDQSTYEILAEFNFTDIIAVRYNGCPSPRNESFNEIHSGLFSIEFNTTERISLTKEHFIGSNLEILYLKSKIDLADNVFSDLRYLDHLTIVSNEVNHEKIFDYPSNVTKIIYQNFSGEFKSEVLKKWPQLTQLSFDDSKIRHLAKKMFGNSSQIQRIFFESSEIESFDSDTFESLEQLTSLCFDSTKIVNIPNRLMVKSENFNYFRIECDESTGFDTLPDEFLSNLPKLNTVFITNCSMKSVPENLFKNSTNIENLDMKDNSLTDLPENFLANQTSLARINLSGNRFTEFSETFFENLLMKPIWSTNRLSAYFIVNGLKRLSQKQISDLSKINGYFDFRYNEITDLSGFDGLVKGHVYSFINLEENPINCECSSVKSYEKNGGMTIRNYQRYIHNTKCATPLSLKDKAVINVDC